MRKELSPWELAALSLFGTIIVFMIFAILYYQLGGWDALWNMIPPVSVCFGITCYCLQRALRTRKVNDSQTHSELGSWEKAILCYDIALLIIVVTLIVGPNFSNWKYMSISGLFYGPFIGAASMFLAEALNARRKARANR